MESLKREPALWRFERLLKELENMMHNRGRMSKEEISILLGVPETYARQLARALVQNNPGRYKYDKGVLEKA